MELQDLAEKYRSFYVPAFDVRIGGASMLHDHLIAVANVEVNLKLLVPGRFSFTIVGAFDNEEREFLSGHDQRILDLLSFGAEIEIFAGYGDRSKLTRLISGTVTEISTGFAEGGLPELSVAGYDHMFPMTLGAKSESWRDTTDSDVASLIASGAGLTAEVDDSGERRAQIEQNQRSDVDFLKELAERNHFTFYMQDARVLRFGRPNDRGDGVLTLRWGRGLLSFRPEANLAAQVTEVEVRHRDPVTKTEFVGRAGSESASGIDPGRESAGSVLAEATGRRPVLRIRQPVFTQAEAQRRAEAILSDHSKKFITGDAECVGLPELLPDRNVTIADIGMPFSKTYYIDETTHKLDGSGYRTRFKVKEASGWT